MAIIEGMGEQILRDQQASGGDAAIDPDRDRARTSRKFTNWHSKR